ncbi:MAG: YvcK family protein, partial [Acidimicrobiaceae bacterium]|nr:YvcK family protein [Acidimicrobiaceae bacterium]
PSNPIVSIGPIRALNGIDNLLIANRNKVVAISPIVGGLALKGPADRMLTELGHESSALGVAQLYASIASTIIIDNVDAELKDAIEREGVRCIVTNTVMSDQKIAAELALKTLNSIIGKQIGQQK